MLPMRTGDSIERGILFRSSEIQSVKTVPSVKENPSVVPSWHSNFRAQVGTMYGTLAKGPRYLEMTDGYVTALALNEDDEIIGYKFVNFGKMMDFIKGGDDAMSS